MNRIVTTGLQVRLNARVAEFSDLIYTIPDSHRLDIEFGQFAVIMTVTTFSFIICCQILYHKFKSHARLESIQFHIVILRITI